MHAFLLYARDRLSFGAAVPAAEAPSKRVNPKRMQRSIARQVSSQAGVGTKAQQVIKLQQEQGKLARKVRARDRREEEETRKFELRQEKRK